MKRLFVIGPFLFSVFYGLPQCPFPVSIASTGGCMGANLNVVTGNTLSSIVWYNGNSVIGTANALSYSSKLIAGSNTAGTASNLLNFPDGICFDAAGNMYISDAGNYRVQKFAPGSTTGVTVAGGNGPGSAATQLDFPRGLYVDAAGNIYVVDDNNSRVQKWAPGATSGVTVAGGNGSGSAANQLSLPYGLFVDATGNIFISDQGNNRVQEWPVGASTGITVAGGNGPGSAANQFDGPMSVFLDASGNIYVADKNNNRIQKWIPGATSGVTVAGGNGPGSAANQLYGEGGVFVDAAGNIYISDYINDRVQKWAPGASAGVTVAGGSLPNSTGVVFGRPTALFVDPSGNVFVTLGGASVQEWGSVLGPINMSYSPPSPGLYYAVVTDNNNCTVTSNTVQIDPIVTPYVNILTEATTIPYCSQVVFNATPSNQGSAPHYTWQVDGVNAGTDYPVFTANNLSNGSVVRCILTTSAACSTAPFAYSNDITMTVTSLPAATIQTKNNNCLGDTLTLSIADVPSEIRWFNNGLSVKTVTAQTFAGGITIAGDHGRGTQANQFDYAESIAFDAAGNLYVSDGGNNRIQKWLPGATAGVTVYGGNGVGTSANQFNYPGRIKFDASGNLYVSDVLNYRIQKFAPGNPNGITVAGGNWQGSNANQFDRPIGFCFDAAGNLLVADGLNNRIQKWAPGATSGVTIAGGNGQGNGANQFDFPYDLCLDQIGNLYVVDMNNNRIQKWSPGATSGITVAGGNGPGTGLNQMWFPTHVFVNAAGDIYVADFNNNRIQKWVTGNPNGIVVAGGNGLGDAANQLYNPNDFILEPDGTIFIADMNNNRVQKWQLQPILDTTFKPASSGNYSAVVTTSGGCQINTNTVAINPNLTPTVTITASSTDICKGSMVNFNTLTINPGSSPIFQWMINGVNQTTGPVFSSNNLSDNDVVSCLMTSNATCVLPDTVSSNPILLRVSLPVVPSANITATKTNLCMGDTVNFMAVPVNAGTDPIYQWMVNDMASGSNEPIFSSNNLNDQDSVVCLITGSSGCTQNQTSSRSNKIVVQVKTNIPPLITITPVDLSVCSGAPITFTANLESSSHPVYNWMVNGSSTGKNINSFQTNSLVNGDVIQCAVSEDESCVPGISNAVTVQIFPTPEIAPNQEFQYTPGQTLMLNPLVSGNISEYNWTPSTGLSNNSIKNPLASPSKTTRYILKVSTTEGCEASADILVKVFTQINIPNAFTPNKDSKNDIFYILGGLEGAVVSDFSVYDRWGERVFQVKNIEPGDPSFGWDGNYRGLPSPIGTYVYVVHVKLSDNTTQIFRGTVTLIR